MNRILIITMGVLIAATSWAGTRIDYEDMSPLQVSARIETHVRSLIAHGGGDRTTEPVGMTGIGSEYTVEIKTDEILITFLEDFDKTWAKSTTYVISYPPRKHIFGQMNNRCVVVITSEYKGGKNKDKSLPTLEKKRVTELKEILEPQQ